MRSQVLTMQRSSQAETSKISILVNELVRRFEVMSDDLDVKEEIEILDHFVVQLRNSGYKYKQARDIVTSALKGIVRKKMNRENERPLKRYKSGAETLQKRIYDKLLEASTWFREKEIERKEKSELSHDEENKSNVSTSR